MPIIKLIRYRKILNSHVNFTNEFVIKFEDGSVGVGSSPQGETISIYEDRKINVDPQNIINTIRSDGLVDTLIDQESFDGYLLKHIKLFGRNNAYGLSEAFFNAQYKPGLSKDLFLNKKSGTKSPCICLNILNLALKYFCIVL